MSAENHRTVIACYGTWRLLPVMITAAANKPVPTGTPEHWPRPFEPCTIGFGRSPCIVRRRRGTSDCTGDREGPVPEWLIYRAIPVNRTVLLKIGNASLPHAIVF